MNFVALGLVLAWLAIVVGGWLGWQLIRQNGRILLRLDDIEERLHALEFGEAEELADKSSPQDPADRFANRSLARSKINRSGLKAGTPAPDFRLPRLDGRGDLSPEELRGPRVPPLFSSLHCGPCDALAAALEMFYREHGTPGHPLTVSPSVGERGDLRAIAVV